MTELQRQLAEAVLRVNAAKEAGDPDWIHQDRERSRILDLIQRELAAYDRLYRATCTQDVQAAVKDILHTQVS
jgi:hypothetical protein